MVDIQRKKKVNEFVEYWKDRGYEKGESQKFWLSLLRDVFGVEKPEKYINFEDKVLIDHTSFIDGMIPETKVLIEQKSAGKDLYKKIRQSDGSYLSPFQQAKKYITELPLSKHPRWIITCNFVEFLIYDMEHPTNEPYYLKLIDLPTEIHRLSFLVNTDNIHLKKEKEISIQAGEIVGHIYDALHKQYSNPKSPDTLRSLNMLCVRIVFCLYAEDAGIFGDKKMFHDYMSQFNTNNWRSGLIELFKVLNTKEEERSDYLSDDLAKFPYVNGGLFEDENIEIPRITDEIIYMILVYGSEQFDWSKISPTIFGAVFESTLNPESRRKGGMHYTSIENIHKVIDPLFLNDLKDELKRIKEYKYSKVIEKKLFDFQNKIATLKFLDPACGSGNFLTESYISLRRLENEIIKINTAMNHVSGQILFGDFEEITPIKVSISQFYGMEINDFAVTVAKTALWIAESQMMKETEDIVHMKLDFLPLKTNAYIIEGNALRIEWGNIISNNKLHFIMGNPPFIGARWMNHEQKEDVRDVFGKEWKNTGNLDYVSCWYKKIVEYIKGTTIRAALVSTNSIVQGETVANLWKPLFRRGVHIDFARRTFVWESEAKNKAKVHCVIIGFSIAPNTKNKTIYINEKSIIVNNINGYLLDTDNIFVESRNKPVSDVPRICLGGQAIDDGYLILTEDEKQQLLEEEPQAKFFIRPYMMGRDFIDRKPRYCIWLVNANPAILKQCTQVLDRVQKVKDFRMSSNRKNTLKAAKTPALFATVVECRDDYIAIPKVSSCSRFYIPIDFLPKEIVPGDKLFVISGASLYHFGVLISNIHMAWVRAISGRLKSDYSYSNTIVYNNFPWCNPSEKQKLKIEETAQGILNARALYPDCSLADLYDDLMMPLELRKAHEANDRAVMQAYGFLDSNYTETDIITDLLKLYRNYTELR